MIFFLKSNSYLTIDSPAEISLPTTHSETMRSSQQPNSYRIRIPSGLMILSEPEGSLTLCGNEVCDQQGLVETPD